MWNARMVVIAWYELATAPNDVPGAVDDRTGRESILAAEAASGIARNLGGLQHRQANSR